jgi:hypothetical protein
MRLLKLISIFLCFNINLNAQDSIITKKMNPKWNLTFNIDNNYNFRYVRKPNFLEYGYPINYDYDQKDWDYLDTNNIACTMKSISAKIERKIYKFIGLQFGLIYGRKGFMGCKDIGTSGYFGKQYLYYTNIPKNIISVPLGLTFNMEIIKNRFFVSMNTGIELNLFYTKNYYYEYSMIPYDYELSGQKIGFFGFRTSKKTDDAVLYVPNKARSSISGNQYSLGIQFKLVLTKTYFLHIGYNYVSDFKFYKVSDGLNSGGTVYERKSYLHRYGGGIGFRF